MSSPKRIKLDVEENEAKIHLQPVLAEDLVQDTPLTSVYVDTVTNAKYISKIVVEINSKFPVPELNHLKRIKNRQVLLFPTKAAQSAESVHAILKARNFDTSLLQNKIEIAKVAAVPPKTRKQYEKIKSYWPCNFHSDKYLERLSTNTLFDACQLKQHATYMKIAIDVAKFTKKPTEIGVVIVDPKINSIVAVGFDQTDVNPTQHPVMVAIDNVSLTQNGGAWSKPKKQPENNLDRNGTPDDVHAHLKRKYDVGFGARIFKTKSEIESAEDGPYLCTGYYAYVTREPCVMCCMALIHSRIKRVFYGRRFENGGGLGSLCKIHVVKDLNHHYEAFAGLLEDLCPKVL